MNNAGVNALNYIRQHPGRYMLAHIKGRIRNVPVEAQWESCNLGAGVIDYKNILRLLKTEGIKHFMVEQEKFLESTPLLSAKKNAAFMKAII